MKKPDFEQKYNEFSKLLMKISEMPNIMDQMRETLKIPKFFEDIWTDGYKQGIESGKKKAFNIKKN